MVRVGGRPYAIRCHICRQRKVKCDGTKPLCERCQAAGLICTGYDRQLQFSHFDGLPKTKTLLQETPAIMPQAKSRTGLVHTGFRLQKPVSQASPTQLLFPSAGPLSSAQYTALFLGTLQDRFLPRIKPPTVSQAIGRGEELCAAWITEACNLARNDGIDVLRHALLALAVTIAQLDSKTVNVPAVSFNYYLRALGGLRAGLKKGVASLSERQAETYLFTCLSCAIFENAYNRSLPMMLQHLKGFQVLLQQRGAENLDSGPSRMVFWEYRAMELGVGIINRKKSFLSDHGWMYPSWRASDPRSNNHMQTLVDIGLKIPPIMQKFDQAKPDNGREMTLKYKIFIDLVKEALELRRKLGLWENNLRRGDNNIQLYRPRLAQQIGTHCVFPFAYDFPSLEIGSILAFYEGTQIYLCMLMIDMLNQLEDLGRNVNLTNFSFAVPQISELTIQALEAADWISQFVGFFFEDKVGMVGRIVITFPFEAARTFYARLYNDKAASLESKSIIQPKIDYCNMIAQQYKTVGIETWRNNI
ncbi:hypothetical protein B0O99DRAFT_740592 [Bisporella sp. PMI_857]|nr:hypothetical protein B0O99DRAFT_740592 [Bisporella sp. PMI_857]